MKLSKLKTLLVALAAAASIPGAMAANHPNQNNGGFPPTGHVFQPNLFPFICNLFGPPTPVDGFSGYINIAGQKGLIIDLQTTQNYGPTFPLTTAGTFTLPIVPTHPPNAHTGFSGLSFDLQGYCNDDGCSGPWVFVDAYDANMNKLFGANVVCSSNFPGCGAGSCYDVGSDNSGFVTQTFSASSFGFTTPVALADVTVQLFPGCDYNHDSRINNFIINGQHATLEQPRTLYNFCPTGFAIDPRPAQCNFNQFFYGPGGPGSGS